MDNGQDRPRPGPAERSPQSDRPIVKSAESARAGFISGRVVTVLIVSLVLAAMVAAGMVYYFWGTAGQTN